MKKLQKRKHPPVVIRIRLRKFPFAKKQLETFVLQVLREIKKIDYGLNVFIVGSRRMKSLHQRYFKDPTDTDCISFSQWEGRKVEGNEILGDVVVSWDQVKRQAPDFGTTPKEELLYCLIHGMLHLLGHDDRTRRARKKMFALQDRIYEKWVHRGHS